VGLVENLLSGDLAGQSFGEAVGIGVHLRQCAALAEMHRAEPPLVAAALLHDVAYVLSRHPASWEDFETRHAEIGAAWAARWFPASVSEPVRLHVEAKRYLTSVDPAYESGLSVESERTLELQGGPMTEGEARLFQAGAHADSAVRLRRFDDLAKDSGVEPPPLHRYLDLLRSLAGDTR